MPDNAPIVVGYSGGGDSTALLHLLMRAANGRRVLAAIVDHALREGSAEDAQRAKSSAERMGAEAHVLTLSWPDGPKPAQAAARAGRLKALAEFTRAHNASAIHFAHTLDDQAETLMLRIAAGTGWRGLAAMGEASPAPVWPEGRGLTLLRPLLNQRRTALRDLLHSVGADWIEDPANKAQRYARVRARGKLAALEVGGFSVERLSAIASRCAPLAAAQDRAALALIDAAVRFEGPRALLERKAFRAAQPEARTRALSALIAGVAGESREADAAAVRRWSDALAGEDGLLGTLGGARIAGRGEVADLSRDPGAVTGRRDKPALAPLALEPGEEAVWDGRLSLTTTEAGWSAHPGPKGQAPLFRRQDVALRLEEAVSSGVFAARWLLRERIAHLLWR